MLALPVDHVLVVAPHAVTLFVEHGIFIVAARICDTLHNVVLRVALIIDIRQAVSWTIFGKVIGPTLQAEEAEAVLTLAADHMVTGFSKLNGAAAVRAGSDVGKGNEFFVELAFVVVVATVMVVDVVHQRPACRATWGLTCSANCVAFHHRSRSEKGRTSTITTVKWLVCRTFYLFRHVFLNKIFFQESRSISDCNSVDLTAAAKAWPVSLVLSSSLKALFQTCMAHEMVRAW